MAKTKQKKRVGREFFEILDNCDKVPFQVMSAIWNLTSYTKAVVAYAISKGVSFATDEFSELLDSFTIEQRSKLTPKILDFCDMEITSVDDVLRNKQKYDG